MRTHRTRNPEEDRPVWPRGAIDRKQFVKTAGGIVIAMVGVGCSDSGELSASDDGTAPDIYSFGFEDGSKGELQNFVGGAASGTVVDTDAARGTRCLQLDYQPTPTNEGGHRVQYILAVPRVDTWVRFAMKHTAAPTAIQKILRFQGPEGIPNRGLGSIILNGSTTGEFVWFGDNYDSLFTQHTGISIQDIVGEWHWWQLHLQMPPGEGIRIEVYFDDLLVAERTTNDLNSANQTLLFVLFNGTLNLGNTVLFSTRFDEIGISSKKMGIPSQ